MNLKEGTLNVGVEVGGFIKEGDDMEEGDDEECIGGIKRKKTIGGLMERGKVDKVYLRKGVRGK